MNIMDDRKLNLQNIILQAVCDVFNLSLQVFDSSRSKMREFADARHVASYCLQENGFLASECASILHRARTTMLNSKRRYADLYETDADFRNKADAVRRIVAERMSVKVPCVEPVVANRFEPDSLSSILTMPAPVHISPEDAMLELKRRKQMHAVRQVQALRQKAEHDKQLLRDTSPEDAAFCLTYVPYVIAELAWDNVDCLASLMKIMRRQETKKLCRALKGLRADYDYNRFKIISREMRDNELENMLVFMRDEEVERFFGNLYHELNEKLTRRDDKLDDNGLWAVSTAHVIHIILQALFRYVSVHEKCASAILGYSINTLPAELRKLDTLILELVGDKGLMAGDDEDLTGHSIEALVELFNSITLSLTD